MYKILPTILCLCLILHGCGQDLHFKIRFDTAEGLSTGAPLVANEQTVGKVIAVESTPEGSQLVVVEIKRKHAPLATEHSRFYLGADPQNLPGKRVEIIQSTPGGKPIAEGAIVQGSSPGLLGLMPFGKIIQEFGDLLRDLRGQVERFSKDIEALPNATEAKILQEEWRKLLDEIIKAQDSAEESLKQEVLPKLQQEMENLRKRLENMQRTAPRQRKPLEI